MTLTLARIGEIEAINPSWSVDVGDECAATLSQDNWRLVEHLLRDKRELCRLARIGIATEEAPVYTFDDSMSDGLFTWTIQSGSDLFKNNPSGRVRIVAVGDDGKT